MKAYFISIFVILSITLQSQDVYTDSASCLYGQKNNLVTYTLDAGNDTIGMNIWEYYGNIATWVYLARENGVWIFRNRTQKTYDDRGNLLSGLSQEYIDNRWINRFLDLYSYDSRNNKTECLMLEFKGKKWQTVSGESISYEYNNENQLTAITYELWNKDGWIKDWRTEFVYNKSVLASSYDYEYKNNKWNIVFRNDYDWYKWEGKATASVLRSLDSFEERNGTWIQIRRPHSRKNISIVSLN